VTWCFAFFVVDFSFNDTREKRQCLSIACIETPSSRALFRIVRRVGLFALAGLVLATPAVGQTGLATVTGLVSDSSGAAVPGVTVTATNQATNIAYTGLTNGAGNYVITSVPIGEYVISAGLTGFKGVQSRVTLSVAQTARVDFKMEVGRIEERVDVIATGAVLQTENAVVGIKADREQVEKLPAISRNVSFVTMYAAGVTQPLMSSFNSLSGGGRPYVNGQLQQANNQLKVAQQSGNKSGSTTSAQSTELQKQVNDLTQQLSSLRRENDDLKSSLASHSSASSSSHTSSDAEAAYQEGKTALKAKKTADALDKFKAALLLDPNNGRYVTDYSIALSDDQQYADQAHVAADRFTGVVPPVARSCGRGRRSRLDDLGHAVPPSD